MEILSIILVLLVSYLLFSNNLLNAMVKDLNIEIHGINKKMHSFEENKSKIQDCIKKIEKVLDKSI